MVIVTWGFINEAMIWISRYQELKKTVFTGSFNERYCLRTPSIAMIEVIVPCKNH